VIQWLAVSAEKEPLPNRRTTVARELVLLPRQGTALGRSRRRRGPEIRMQPIAAAHPGAGSHCREGRRGDRGTRAAENLGARSSRRGPVFMKPVPLGRRSSARELPAPSYGTTRRSYGFIAWKRLRGSPEPRHLRRLPHGPSRRARRRARCGKPRQREGGSGGVSSGPGGDVPWRWSTNSIAERKLSIMRPVTRLRSGTVERQARAVPSRRVLLDAKCSKPILGDDVGQGRGQAAGKTPRRLCGRDSRV